LFTDKSNSLKGRFFDIHILLVVDEAEEDFDEILPLIMGELDGGDGGDNLSGELACSLIWRTEGHEGVLFKLIADVGVEVEPSLGELFLPCWVL
jgi:hypothetical protein